MIQDSFNANIADTMGLKKSISSTLLNGRKLILITESQGNFFGKQAIQDLLNGEALSDSGKTGKIKDYLGVFGQLQISPPTGSLLTKNKVVLNDKDLINIVFFEKPNSNFDLVLPSPDLRSVWVDRIANHFITSTYLNDENMTTGNLSALKNFTLQSVVDLASTLESNCYKSVINYTKNNLQFNFDSIDPEDQNVSGHTYIWEFGDGEILSTTSKNITHTYAQPGNYLVTLTVKDIFGATDKTSTNVVADLGLQKARFKYKVNLLNVKFNATQLINPDQPGIIYSWDFGDGTSLETSNKLTSHNYQNPGVYAVKLVLTRPNGKVFTNERSVLVVNKPGDEFKLNYLTAGKKVSFEVLSTLDLEDVVTSYEWSFGDGKSEVTGENVVDHVYDNLNSYVVQVKLRDINGALINTIEQTISNRSYSNINYFHSARDFSFTLDHVLLNEPIVLSYVWDFGDGQSALASDQTILHRYANVGSYTVRVNVFDEAGVLLFNSVSIAVVDETSSSSCVTDADQYYGMSGESYLRNNSGILPTSVSGFFGEVQTVQYGTCYVKDFTYFGNTVCMPYYNCTNYDLIK